MHKYQQTIKWTVYTLLLIYFAYYIHEDWTRSQYILTSDSSWFKWTTEYATSIDEAAWFFLLFMFELETYVLEDKTLKGWVEHLIHGIRIVCYLMLAHTLFAFTDTIADLQPTVAVEGVTNLCEMTDAEVSYVYNLEYTDVVADNCADISTATNYYWVADDPVVADMPGLELERDLAWVDLAEAVVWLIIIAAIELVVRLQSHGVTAGRAIAAATRTKYFLYSALIAMGIYWAWLGHWLYLWDELVWIGGFAAIEMNVSEWRAEINEEQGVTA